MTEPLSRRDAARLALAALGLTLTPQALWAAAAAAASPRDTVLDAVCDIVIPLTATPGAVQAGVPDFVRLCLAHADGQTLHGDEWRHVAAQLGGPTFIALDAPARTALLTRIDQAAFAPAPDALGQAWRAVKQLIVTGYYTSEAGGAQELRYELVPGRFDPDVAVTPATAEMSNDWIAVSFR